MSTKILMNVCDGGECRVAVIENGILQEYFVDRPSQLTHVGDVYRAVVSNVETAIQAAFVDIGSKKNAFLHVSDVIAAYSPSTRLEEIYGTHIVEVIPVEEIDFNTLPERANVLDDEDLEDESGESREPSGEERAHAFEDDDIEAPGIMPKAEFMQSRDEAAILRTVDLERHAVGHEGSEHGGSAAAGQDAWTRSGNYSDGQGANPEYDSDYQGEGQHGDTGQQQRREPSDLDDLPQSDEHAQSGQPERELTPEEAEERAKEETRRRKGMRRRNGNERDDGGEGHRDRFGRKGRHGKDARPALTQVASAISQRHAPVPAPEPKVEPKPVAARRPAAPQRPIGPPPVEIQGASSARMKIAPRVKPAADSAPAPVAEHVPVVLPAAAPVKAEVIEARASARVKLAIPAKKKPEAAAEPVKAAEPEAASTDAAAPAEEASVHAKHRAVRRAPRRKAAAGTDAPASSDASTEPGLPQSSSGTPEVSEFQPFDMDVTGDSSLDKSSSDGFADGSPARFFRRGPLPRLGSMLSRGQEVLVQVTRAAQGGKGPSVTTYLSLPGRYMVLMPNTSKCGVSRKIRDDKTRVELRRALRRLRIPEGMGVIIRTAAAGRPIEELQRDLNYLLKLWNGIVEDMTSGTRGPSCAYRDSDPAVRTVRDYFTKDVTEIVIDDREVYDRVMLFFADLMPDYANRVRFYDGGTPLFVREGVEPQIEHIFDKKVPLPSGGYLYVEQTEALVAIDVNSGRFTSESSAEITAYKTNMEAVPEIVRQLRLRDLGGIVVGDFIDMLESRHRRDVEERLKTELRKGRARVKVATTSPFGLIEMTRQRVRPSIRVYTYDECPCCGGFGHVMSPETQALRLLRAVRMALAGDESFGVVVSAPANVLSYLHSNLRGDLAKIEQKYDKPVTFEWDPMLESEELRLFFINRRGDRTTFNLPAEMNRFASQRQLVGFDDGGGRRRKRRRRTDQDGAPDDGIGADSGNRSNDTPEADEGSRHIESRQFSDDRAGHSRRDRPQRDDGGHDDAGPEGGRGERRRSSDRRDAERRDGRHERRDGRGPRGGKFERRAGERRGDPTHPKAFAGPVAAHGDAPVPTGDEPVAAAHEGPVAGAPAGGPPSDRSGPDASRRRRGRRGGRRHRRGRDGQEMQPGQPGAQGSEFQGQPGFDGQQPQDGQQYHGEQPHYDPNAAHGYAEAAPQDGGYAPDGGYGMSHGNAESAEYAQSYGEVHGSPDGGFAQAADDSVNTGGDDGAPASRGGRRPTKKVVKKAAKKVPTKKVAVKKAPAKKAPAKKAVKKKAGS